MKKKISNRRVKGMKEEKRRMKGEGRRRKGEKGMKEEKG